MGVAGAEGEVGAPGSGIEADVVDSVPKTMQALARRLMEHLKRDISWTAHGELVNEDVPVARRSLSWTHLGCRRSQMEHSMLTPPPERQRKALASLASWEDI